MIRCEDGTEAECDHSGHGGYGEGKEMIAGGVAAIVLITVAVTLCCQRFCCKACCAKITRVDRSYSVSATAPSLNGSAALPEYAPRPEPTKKPSTATNQQQRYAELSNVQVYE